VSNQRLERSYVSTTNRKLLRQALLHDGEMQRALYQHELAGVVEELKHSLAQDNDDYIFTVTENRGHVAMVLIEKTGQGPYQRTGARKS